MRGRDQAHVGPDRLVAADALERLLLQQPQHLGLQGQRHVADLVEEQGAAVALLELADAAAVGAGEGALLVAEQLALQQVLRDGGAVERQERRLGAGAVLVDGARDQLLAGAALAGDQHRHVLGGDAANGLVDLAAWRGRSRRWRPPRRRPAAVSATTAGSRIRRATSSASPTTWPQLVQVERLEQVVVGALLHRLDGRVRRLGHGDEDDRDAGVDGRGFAGRRPGRTGRAGPGREE